MIPAANLPLAPARRTACASALLGAVLLAGCASTAAPPLATHLEPAQATLGKAPEFVVPPPLPKPPKPAPRQETYSVVVNHMPVQELLFALARDAKLNIDIHPGIGGTVTMNLLDQTLTEILDRVAGQVDMRYELNGNNLSVLPDAPFLKVYRVDYPNIQRNAHSAVSTSTNIAASGSAPGMSLNSSNNTSASSILGTGGTNNNSSTTVIANTSNNRFWETLVTNLRDLLRETDKILPEGSSETVTEHAGQLASTAQASASGNNNSTRNRQQAAPLPAQMDTHATSVVRRTTYREAASIIANAESGVISVRATRRQHEKVREFLDRIMGSAHRQVLIEATIVEVDLSDRYQQGIDWSLLRNAGSAAGSSIVVQPSGPNSNLLTGGVVGGLATLTWKKAFGNVNVNAALKLLESFGNLRVLSSPKISVLNSQTSVLKVVDNEVYFTITVTPGTAATATSPATQPTYSTALNTVPIGFLMTVTPQISDNGEVILNLRPTISRISGYAMDPNPILAEHKLSNPIPIVQTREMESVLRVQSGDIAILGGLMQDSRGLKSDEVPGLNRVPVLGDVFRVRDSNHRKSELVVFLRPTVLNDASLDGDFRAYRGVLSESRAAMAAPADPAHQ